MTGHPVGPVGASLAPRDPTGPACRTCDGTGCAVLFVHAAWRGRPIYVNRPCPTCHGSGKR